jgi:hypothetical protein
MCEPLLYLKQQQQSPDLAPWDFPQAADPISLRY